MGRFSIGIMSDSLRLGLREGIRCAAQLGAQGVQLYAVRGGLNPTEMTAPARKHLASFIQDEGLTVSALCADAGGYGLERENPAELERYLRVMDLALDLSCTVVTTHIGVVPREENHPRYAVMAGQCRKLGEASRERGAFFAVETGPEPASVLRAFLDAVGSPGIGVNLDPANLVMVAGDDPVAAVNTLAPYIVHTHAKDGVMVRKTEPETIYHAFAEGREIRTDDYYREAPLGEGAVPWEDYLAALECIGYRGFLTIEREAGPKPVEDIAKAVRFLQKLG